jgi:hypothetical protein
MKKNWKESELMMNPIMTPSRRKAIKTIMRRRNVSFEDAMKIQAKAITREQNNAITKSIKKRG